MIRGNAPLAELAKDDAGQLLAGAIVDGGAITDNEDIGETGGAEVAANDGAAGAVSSSTTAVMARDWTKRFTGAWTVGSARSAGSRGG